MTTTAVAARRLDITDDYLHPGGPEANWNEGRHIHFLASTSGVGGWFRIGMRPNEGHAEMSACITYPDGRSPFYFTRAPITGNGLSAGGQEWMIGDPYRLTTVSYDGPLAIFDDPWALTDPKAAFASAPTEPAAIALRVESYGLDAVMGSDQAHIDRIFLPGQADWHYQHLCRVTGTVTVGDRTFAVDGRGAKDHSWGPRNWLAKIWFRWLIAATEDGDLGFLLTRAVGPTKQPRGGAVSERGTFLVGGDFQMGTTYAGRAPYQLLRTEVVARAGTRTWTASGEPMSWLPLRHRG